MRRSILIGCIALCSAAAPLAGQAPAPAPAPAPPSSRPPVVLAQVAKQPPADAPDLTKRPTLFVVGYAHLDTEWRWDYPQVINEYLKDTLDKNFALIQKYPHYIFNFTGANRYAMFQEYYPERFVQLKQYIAEGRWFPGGASMEENDVNSPNAESILRQVLYGNEYFRKEFGKAAVDYMLPDCFGFPASLPSILSHAGLLGFSTQKLNSGWQPAARVGGPDSPEGTPEGIPFNVGVWTGPDGHSILGAVNPGSYSGGVTTDLTKAPLANLVPYAHGLDAVTDDGRVSGLYTDYHYVGTGDIGGSPDEESVKIMEATID
ncbi:MAG: alpha-mannosidase, partial [Terriglobales bacterium]